MTYSLIDPSVDVRSQVVRTHISVDHTTHTQKRATTARRCALVASGVQGSDARVRGKVDRLERTTPLPRCRYHVGPVHAFVCALPLDLNRQPTLKLERHTPVTIH